MTIGELKNTIKNLSDDLTIQIYSERLEREIDIEDFRLDGKYLMLIGDKYAKIDLSYDDFIEEYETYFDSSLRNSEIETGMENDANRQFDSLFDGDAEYTMKLTEKLFNQYYNDGETKWKSVNGLCNILRNLSHFDNINKDRCEDIFPIAFELAAKGLNHKDCEVQDWALNCFSGWGKKEAIPLIKSIKFNDWLQKYADDIIKDLENENENQ